MLISNPEEMIQFKELCNKIKPQIPKRYLLFVAGIFWSIGGGILFARSISIILKCNHIYWIEIIISLVAGSLFYIFLFERISLKHIRRILQLKIDFPCIFSFFNYKGYLLMCIMIGFGISLRKSGLIPEVYVPALYLTMAIPLLISSFRFIYQGVIHFCD